MKIAFLAMFMIGVMPIFGLAAEQKLPEEVTTFLDQRESYDHWRGEEGCDKARRAEIDWSICQLCPGTDSKLTVLKKKYRANKVVMDKLFELEAAIEPDDKGSTMRFCRSLKKPKSLEDN